MDCFFLFVEQKFTAQTAARGGCERKPNRKRQGSESERAAKETRSERPSTRGVPGEVLEVRSGRPARSFFLLTFAHTRVFSKCIFRLFYDSYFFLSPHGHLSRRCFVPVLHVFRSSEVCAVLVFHAFRFTPKIMVEIAVSPLFPLFPGKKNIVFVRGSLSNV